MARTLGLLSLGLFALAACGGEAKSQKIDIGETGTRGEQLSDYAATWQGYAEAYEFSDGTDTVQIKVNSNGAGYLQVGDAPIFAGATDPEAIYPPTETFDNPIFLHIETFRSGFRFPLESASVSSRRLQIDVNTGHTMDSWCALQTPYPDASCLPNRRWVVRGEECFLLPEDVCTDCFPPPEDGQEQVSCFKLNACRKSNSCACDATSCTGSEGDPISIDAVLGDDGESLEGTLITPRSERIKIRLERVTD